MKVADDYKDIKKRLELLEKKQPMPERLVRCKMCNDSGVITMDTTATLSKKLRAPCPKCRPPK